MSCLSKACVLNVRCRQLTVIRLLHLQFVSGNEKVSFFVFVLHFVIFTINDSAHNQKINLLWDCEAYIKKANSMFI